MAYHLDDTIAAIASPPGGGYRGILRLAGPGVVACLNACFVSHQRGSNPLESARRASVVQGTLNLHDARARLPCDLLFWPGPRSYTGGPLAEVHTLGSPPLLDAALRNLCRAGARPAEPGEFTLRAFLSGRIDLTEAEAVMGIIDAADARRLDLALAQLAGGLARPLHRLREDLLDLLSHLETGLDFADEDLSFIAQGELLARLQAAQAAVAAVADQMASRGRSDAAGRAAIVGLPNAGKSRLFNVLTRRGGAIVSPVAGTTRDYLTARLDLAGVSCVLVDTAGRESADEVGASPVAAAAQRLADEQATAAEVRLVCLDSSRPIDAWEQSQLDRDASPDRVLVWTKVDLAPGRTLDRRALATSSATGAGLDPLRERLREALLAASGGPAGAVAITAARCADSVRTAAASLHRASNLVDEGGGEELVAAEVRTALDALGHVVGAVYAEDLLDRIFSRFCIGK